MHRAFSRCRFGIAPSEPCFKIAQAGVASVCFVRDSLAKNSPHITMIIQPLCVFTQERTSRDDVLSDMIITWSRHNGECERISFPRYSTRNGTTAAITNIRLLFTARTSLHIIFHFSFFILIHQQTDAKDAEFLYWPNLLRAQNSPSSILPFFIICTQLQG